MTNFDYPARFLKNFIFYQKTGPFEEILALQTNEPVSKFLSFLSHNLFVKRFFSSENVHFSVKIEGFWRIFQQNRG